MGVQTIAYLAPEIPSVSGTFVYREIRALEALENGDDVMVRPFTLRAVSADAVAPDGQAFAERTRVVYAGAREVLRGALVFALRHPWRALAATALALRDGARPGMARRWKLAPKLVAGLRLAGQLERGGVRHLHIHFAHAPATVGMYAAYAARIPFSITAHANDLYVHPELLREKLERARPFVTISERNRSYLRERFGDAAKRVELVHCGVDTARFQPVLERDRTRTVFAVGRLVPKKGFDLLLDAMALLDARTRCVIAGDGPEREALESRADELGLADRVQFLGAVQTDEIRGWMRRADVFALPCRRAADGDVDGIPVVLMEAMASGLPVVSIGVSGVPELVIDGETGLLAEEGNTRSLARAIQRLLDDRSTAVRLASAAVEHVRRDFDQAACAARLARLIQVETASRASSHSETVEALEGRFAVARPR